MLVEVLLQLLIGQIDAELLKVVLLEALKACTGRSRRLTPRTTAYTSFLVVGAELAGNPEHAYRGDKELGMHWKCFSSMCALGSSPLDILLQATSQIGRRAGI